MSFSLFLFLSIGLGIIFESYRINDRLLNIPTILVAPYLVISLLNNTIMIKYGFYKISDSTLQMLVLSIICLSLGTFLIDFKRKKKKATLYYQQSDTKFEFYKLKKMLKYVLAVEVVTASRFIYTLYTRGAVFVVSDEYESGLLRGLLGHIFLTIYPLIPILFYYWLKHKKEMWYLVASLIGISLYFLTFVKYHSIGLVVLIFFFAALEDRQYFKKGLLVVSGLSIVFFVLNYYIAFATRGSLGAIKKNYFGEHLWNYMAGSLIYDDYVFSTGVRVGVSIFYKLLSFTMSPLNLALNKLNIDMICPHIVLPNLPVGTNGERGNIVDLFGYLFPSKGSVFEIALFGFVLFVLGVLFAKVYNKGLALKMRFAVSLCVFLTFFVFFSFFGTFYVSYVPYEILLWSYVMLMLFDKRTKIRWH